MIQGCHADGGIEIGLGLNEQWSGHLNSSTCSRSRLGVSRTFDLHRGDVLCIERYLLEARPKADVTSIPSDHLTTYSYQSNFDGRFDLRYLYCYIRHLQCKKDRKSIACSTERVDLGEKRGYQAVAKKPSATPESARQVSLVIVRKGTENCSPYTSSNIVYRSEGVEGELR